MSRPAYIGLGANLGQPAQQLRDAVHALDRLPGCALKAVSRLYRSTPLGPAGQPDYTNAAVLLATTLTPHQLLLQLQALEQEAGRVRAERWGPRVLDLDLLLYADDIIRTPELTVPHPELAKRAFVVLPLLDLDPDLALPNGPKLASLATAALSADIRVTDDHHWWHAPR